MHDDDEWGNLGDFDANDPNIIIASANRIKSKNPEWKKKQKEGILKVTKTEKWRQEQKIRNEKAISNPEFERYVSIR